MAENQTNGPGAADAGQRRFAVQRIYVKDLSFEAPNAPQCFLPNQGETETQMNLRSDNRAVGENVHEVVLHISIHARIADKTMFLLELDQCGVFEVSGCSDEEKKVLLGNGAASILFPYAREAVTSLVGRGGFPPLVLQPINFDALAAQSAQSQQPNA